MAAQAECTSAPQLDISFGLDRAGNTFLDRRIFRWPFTISRTFRLDRAPAGMLTVMLQSVSGAIQAGDNIRQVVRVLPGAQGHLTTQSATSVYRARCGTSASDAVEITVEDGAMLEYLPEPRILFPDADLTQSVRARVAAGGVVLIADSFVVHRPERADREFRRFVSEIRIETPTGELISLERAELAGRPERGGPRARYKAFGSLAFVAPTGADRLRSLCAELNGRLAALGPVYAAASLLPAGRGLGLRVAAEDGRHLRQAMQAGWFAIRKELCGDEPVLRAR